MALSSLSLAPAQAGAEEAPPAPSAARDNTGSDPEDRTRTIADLTKPDSSIRRTIDHHFSQLHRSAQHLASSGQEVPRLKSILRLVDSARHGQVAADVPDLTKEFSGMLAAGGLYVSFRSIWHQYANDRGATSDDMRRSYENERVNEFAAALAAHVHGILMVPVAAAEAKRTGATAAAAAIETILAEMAGPLEHLAQSLEQLACAYKAAGKGEDAGIVRRRFIRAIEDLRAGRIRERF